ncbi:MAG: sigma-70 family RNA polymerase sigma factor [Acidimicrobiales bacterium]|nr:sigma-70 family RNA polymerase sigma factor [Acidimicrobiales bacterium]MCB1261936.1 sigma-70 family RNA polymerase sigma factor [Acidimicrobiales bacterium]
MTDDGFEQLFRQEFAPLVRALAVACGDPRRAEDAVQDAFVQAHRHWRRVRGYDQPGAWVRRAALHRLVDQERSAARDRHRRRRLAAQPTNEPLGHEHATVARAELVDALGALPERQRLVVCLHYLADLSVDDVAAALEVAPGTVKSQLHDARSNLLRSLEVRDG